MTSTSRTRRRRPITIGPQIGLLAGRWTVHERLRLSIDDIGFRQGATAVERMRTYGGGVFHLDDHLERWHQTIEVVGIKGLPLRTATAVLIEELIARNQAFIESVGDFGITMFATPGVAGGPSIGSPSPTFGMHLNVVDHELVHRRRQQGQPLVVTNVSQPPASSWPRSIKVRSRLHYYLADQIAADCQAGAVGVLIDQDGSITETGLANLAIVKSGRIVSPARDRVLAGITQRVVEGIARDLSIEWDHSTITPQQMVNAKEILLMGTDGGLWFARSVSKQDRTRPGTPKRAISGGPSKSGGQSFSGIRPGPIYQRLLARFDDLTGC